MGACLVGPARFSARTPRGRNQGVSLSGLSLGLSVGKLGSSLTQVIGRIQLLVVLRPGSLLLCWLLDPASEHGDPRQVLPMPGISDFHVHYSELLLLLL